METGFGEAMPTSPSCSGSSSSSDVGNFECNICFDLAQDPIVTHCGHLFCWPCLYRWLHIHSRLHECPVCKAGIEEEKLVPLYGRGKNSTDPRSKSIPGMEIPHRPIGQRPETAPPPDPNANAFAQQGYGFMGGFSPFGSFAPVDAFAQQGYGFMGGFSTFGSFAPVATARFGNFTLSTEVSFYLFLTSMFIDFRLSTCIGQVLVSTMGILMHSMEGMLRGVPLPPAWRSARTVRFYT